MSENKAAPPGPKPDGRDRDDSDSASGTPAAAASARSPAPRMIRFLARHALPALALVALVLWLPGIVKLPAIDRDESRFAQSSRQMLESGDIVDIRFAAGFPATRNWSASIGCRRQRPSLWAFLTEISATAAKSWTYRLPSLLGGVTAAWLTFWSGSLFSAETGLIAGRLLMATLLLTVEASMAATDAVLLAAGRWPCRAYCSGSGARPGRTRRCPPPA